jgi:hypothetical protein
LFHNLKYKRQKKCCKEFFNYLTFDALLLYLFYMAIKGKPYKDEKDKKVKYGISIDRNLFEKMKKEEVSISKFIQKLVKQYYEKIQPK